MCPDHQFIVLSVCQNAPRIYYDCPRVGQRQKRTGGSGQQRQISRYVFMMQVERQELEYVVRTLIERSSQFLNTFDDFVDKLLTILAMFFATPSFYHPNNFVVVLEPPQQIFDASDLRLVGVNLKLDDGIDDVVDVLSESEGSLMREQKNLNQKYYTGGGVPKVVDDLSRAAFSLVDGIQAHFEYGEVL